MKGHMPLIARRLRTSVILIMLTGLWIDFAPRTARAEVLIAIDKATQQMTVTVDNQTQHVWKVSTGLGGGPPNGTYRPERMERSWYSRKFGMSPMPHSIFFHQGYAIHGTIYVANLGQRASHGCVRLHPDNATILFDLVRSRGMAHTVIQVHNSSYPPS
jgi:lipoprotein-anchoring transpeptidase ErfK/SrfK